MSAHRTAAQIESLTGGMLMSLMVAAETGRQRAMAREDQRREVLAHNAAVARARAVRKRQAAVTAAQVAVGEQRLARWLERVAH